MKAANDDALDRFNRSYEYDGLGDAYARFLLDELLPEVEKKTTTDGRPIKLSKDGNDRGIGGREQRRDLRFTAAWERPDAFTPRLQRASAPTSACAAATSTRRSIRKFEPKPIRVFLQDGEQRPEHLRRRLVDGEPGDGAGADVRRLRSEARVGRGRPQRQARDRDLPRRDDVAVEGLAGAGEGRGRARSS